MTTDYVKKLMLLPCAAIALLASCSVIDDSNDDCGGSYKLDYELRLVTNLHTELRTQLQTELSTQAELSMANALQGHLGSIFTDHAHDVDLSFYDTQGDSARLQHDSHVMDANQASYTLYLPMRQYMHTAVANTDGNGQVSLQEDTLCHTAQLAYNGRTDTIGCQATGLFTARQAMEVLSDIDQTFNVHLYMANCAAALVVDTVGSGIRDLRVLATGFASAFRVADSTYVFSNVPPVVRTQRIDDSHSGGLMAFCAVTFPSPETPRQTAQQAVARSVLDTDAPFVSPEAADALWELHAYATTANGDVTLTKLYVRRPLRAGQLKVIRATVRPEGYVSTGDHTVAVNVTLNWTPGWQYEPEL